MSWLPTSKKELEDNQYIDAVVLPRTSDIGNFEVHRALPSKENKWLAHLFFGIKWVQENSSPGRV